MAVAESKSKLHSPACSDDHTWQMPRRSPCARMQCHDLLFMHWPIHACHLRPLLPAGVDLETFDGQAWIGIVPFRLSCVTGKWLPPLPWISGFPEVVVRTCVSVNGSRGIWYFSLDGTNRLALFLGRHMFCLPCFESKITLRRDGPWRRFHSQRMLNSKTAAELDVEYRAIGAAAPATAGTLDYWLTERDCLFTTSREGQILRGDLKHSPWRLQNAQAIIHKNTMTSSLRLALPDQCPRLLFAEHSHVSSWRVQADQSQSQQTGQY